MSSLLAHEWIRETSEGTPIIWISGLATDRYGWLHQTAFFSRYAPLLLVDNLGAGRSQTDQPFTWEESVEALCTLLQELSIEKFHIVGHSMGANLALEIAQRFPDQASRLVCLCSSLEIPSHTHFVLQNLLELERLNLPPKQLASQWFQWIYSEEFFRNPQNVTASLQAFLKHPFPQRTDNFEYQLRSMQKRGKKSYQLSDHQELLTIATREDRLLPYHYSLEMARELGQKETLLVDQGGHALILEKPQIVNRAIRDFLLD